LHNFTSLDSPSASNNCPSPNLKVVDSAKSPLKNKSTKLKKISLIESEPFLLKTTSTCASSSSDNSSSLNKIENNSIVQVNSSCLTPCTPRRKKLHQKLLPYTKYHNYHPQFLKQQSTNYQQVTSSNSSPSTNFHNNTCNNSYSFHLKSHLNHPTNSHQSQSLNQFDNFNNKFNNQFNKFVFKQNQIQPKNFTFDDHQQIFVSNRLTTNKNISNFPNLLINKTFEPAIEKISSNSIKTFDQQPSFNIPLIKSLNSIRLKRIQSPNPDLNQPKFKKQLTDRIIIEQVNLNTVTDQVNQISTTSNSTNSSDLIIPISIVNYLEQENNSSLANSFKSYLYRQISPNSDFFICDSGWSMGQKNSSVLKSANLPNGSPSLNTTGQLNLSNSPSFNTSNNSIGNLNNHSHHSILSNNSSLNSSNLSTNSTLHSSGQSSLILNGNILGNSISSGQSVAGASNNQSNNSSSNNVLWRSNKNNISNLNNNNNNNSKNVIYNECNELVGQRPSRLDTLLDMPPVSYEEQVKHSWNPDDRSLNIFVKEEDPFTLHRHPVAQSTDCIRGRVGYTRGLHVFQIHWNVRQRGTHAVIGVCTIDAALHAAGYQGLIGCDENSYGFDMGRNKLYHDIKNREVGTYPTGLGTDETLVVPDDFLAVLDMDEGTLSFVVDGQYLGVAFSGLKGKKLYLVVSAVWGHCEITMKYYGGLDPEPLPLKDICRRQIRMQVGKGRLHRIEKELILPNELKSYLLYKDMKR